MSHRAHLEALFLQHDGLLPFERFMEEALYGNQEVTFDKDVIAYCRIGERSSHSWFVLKYLLGFENVQKLVNDELAGRPILVSYCPLCGTGIVFDRRVEGEARRFGVSGLLYRSDLLMYDRETESLWSQFTGAAIAGLRASNSPQTAISSPSGPGRRPNSLGVGTPR